MSSRKPWTRKQLLIAFKLYCEIPFGKITAKNSKIIKYSQLIDRTPSALSMKLANISSLDPVIISSGRKGLSAAAKADREMWDEMHSDWGSFAVEINNTLKEMMKDGCVLKDEILGGDFDESDYTSVDKIVQSTTRIGQDLFRRSVLSAYESKCCITGLNIPELLVASHIIPWRIDNKNRLNPRNGLCLSMLHDKAFDVGLITVTEKMTVKVSSKYSFDRIGFYEKAILSFDGKSILLPDKFRPNPDFLEYHRQVIFES